MKHSATLGPRGAAHDPGQDSGHNLGKSDFETLAEFRYLLRQFGAFSAAAARQVGLTAQQHQALLAIKGFPGREQVTIGELAERLNLKHHSVVGLVDRLTARGLLKRRHDEEDRRKVRIELTPKSEALLLGLTLAHRDELRRLAPLLNELLQKLQGATHASHGSHARETPERR